MDNFELNLKENSDARRDTDVLMSIGMDSLELPP